MRWNLVRWVVVRESLKPIPIYAGRPPEPLDAEWAGVVEVSDINEGRTRDDYALALYGPEGACLEWLQFETLEIALDQARDILGIEHDEWSTCRLAMPVTEGGGVLKWTDLA